jgi:hypothetical protein
MEQSPENVSIKTETAKEQAAVHAGEATFGSTEGREIM